MVTLEMNARAAYSSCILWTKFSNKLSQVEDRERPIQLKSNLESPVSKLAIRRGCGFEGVPVLLVGTWLGMKLYGRLDEAAFRRVVLILLLASGLELIF
jgi:hypothetical protein